uniref:MD-2-related lipid-recognition domain-containing protein n=1 Tax=Stomoxys calcitrans TaxID=35570 RepID=A0A1I8P1J9_STOCA
MLCKLFVALLALCLLTLTLSANRRYDLKLYGFNCKNLTSRISVLECSSRNLKTPNYYALQGKIMFDRKLSENFEMRIWIYIRPSKSKNGVQFLDLKFKTCDILENAFQNPMLSKLFAEFRRTSNIPHTCPINSNFLYRMDNFTVNEKYAPTYAPLLNFTFGLDFYEKTQLLWTAKVTGSLVPKTSQGGSI